MLSEATTEHKGSESEGASGATNKALAGHLLRIAVADPGSLRAAERAAWALLSAMVAALDPETAKAALYEVIAFAQAYRGASEAIWIGCRVRLSGSGGWGQGSDAEFNAVMESGRTMLRGSAEALYWHPLSRLVTAMCAAVFTLSPREVAAQLGETDGESECRDARMAIRVCRRALATLRGVR